MSTSMLDIRSTRCSMCSLNTKAALIYQHRCLAALHLAAQYLVHLLQVVKFVAEVMADVLYIYWLAEQMSVAYSVSDYPNINCKGSLKSSISVG